MAVAAWVGATNTSWDTDSNWDPVAVPGTGDDILFYGSPTYNLKLNIDHNYTLAAIRVASSFTGEIGASGTELICGATVVHIDAKNAGNIYLKGFSADHEFDTIHVVDTAQNATLYLDGFLGNGAGFDLFFTKGRIDIATGATIQANSDVYIGYKHSPISDVILNIAAGATLTTVNFEVRGGMITSLAAVPGALALLDGRWTQGDEIGSTTGTVAALTQRGGHFIWNAGTLTLATIFAGLLDASQGKEARTLTSLSLHANAKANLNNGLNNITVTNPINIYGGSAQVLVSPGATLAVA